MPSSISTVKLYAGKKIGILTLLKPKPKISTKWKHLGWVCVYPWGEKIHLRNNSIRALNGQNKKPPRVIAMTYIMRQYQQQAKKRGLLWKLPIKRFLFLTASKCHYCGILPVSTAWAEQPRLKGNKYNGIDRVSNDLGYTRKNCVPCCINCNRAKSSLSKRDFFALVRRIARHSLNYK